MSARIPAEGRIHRYGSLQWPARIGTVALCPIAAPMDDRFAAVIR